MKLKLLKIARFFNLISKRKYNEKRQIEIVKKSPLFDAKWYLAQNPDIKSKKMGAAKHYVKYGWKEGRNPSKDFDGNAYLQEYPELVAKNWCPLFHYMTLHKELMPKVSVKEIMHNLANKYSKKYKGKSNDYKLIAKSKYFNKRWYLKQYPDVKKAGIDPIEHYMKYGWKEGRNPSKKFNGKAYLAKYNDVKNAKINPLLHYEKFGKKEGRTIYNYPNALLVKIVKKIKEILPQKQRTKILLISHEMTYTGAPLSLLQAAKCFKDKGYKVCVVSLRKGDLAREFKRLGIKVRIVSSQHNFNLFVQAVKCDIAIVNTLVPYMQYEILSQIMPTIWWVREPVSMLQKHDIMRSVFIKANNIFAMSEFSKNQFTQYNNDIKVIKHGIEDKYNNNKKWPKQITFAVIGSISQRKGQDIFVDAVNRLPAELKKQAKFYIVGKSNNKQYYNMLKMASSDVEYIDAISNHNQMLDFYRNISCVVIPSREEPTSRVAIEAMMMGVPVIMSDQVGAQYLMNNKNGFIFENENSNQLSYIMSKIINHPENLLKMSIAARKAYLENNSIEKLQNNLIQMIQEVNPVCDKSKKILVHLHLYYRNQLDYFIKKLKNITCNYDLYVTMVDLDEIVINKLKQFKPNVKIINVVNRGYDVYPFWKILQEVNLDDYFAVLKIHTKNCRDTIWVKDGIPYKNYDWRNDLIEPLIGNKFLFRKCLKKIQSYKCGMVYSKNLERSVENNIQKEITKGLCKKFGYEYQQAPFACGTMFLIKSNCLIDFKNYKLREEDFSLKSATGVVGTLAHALETFFGIIVVNYGLCSVGVHSVKTKIKDLKRKLAKLFKKRPKKYAKDITYIEKSKYFDKKWYLKTYSDVKKAKIDPAKHYLCKGWKEGRNPSLYFNTKWYLERYKDVKNVNINPLLHYEKNGKHEGRSTSNCDLKPLNIFDYPMQLRKQVSLLPSQKIIKNDLPIIVSLTTYPARIYAVIETINSIFSQTCKPDKIILWLTYEEFPRQEKELPQELLELKKYGLTIGWCHNLRSYNKLLPSLKKYPNALHITIDDDIIYKPTLIEKLYKSYLKYPKDIQCHRVTKLCFNEGYKTVAGGKDYYKNGSFLNKLTGVGGVLYPVGCFYKDIFDVDLIKKLAPTNDDQWFWFQSVLNGVKTRVVDEADPTLDYVEGSQETGLYLVNDKGNNLFWRDFKCLMEYYPQVDKIFKRELRIRKYEKILNVFKSYILLPYNQLVILNYKRKQKKLPVKNYKYYSELSSDLYPVELQEWYKRMTGYELNLDNPKTFNEKIQWLKLYNSTPKKTKLADKYLVRKWVKNKIGEKYLIPLLGIYNKFEDIDFNQLPDKFVIKCNHGSGWNIIVKDKSKLDLIDVKQKLDKWMNTNFAFQFGFELHYRDMKPKIIIEEFIENQKVSDLYDYKFWCFDGKVKYIQFLSERSSGELKMAFYDTKWQKQNFVYNHHLDTKLIEKPNNLKEMISLAEKLSKGFNHTRIDLYRMDNGKIYFGEITFSSMSGVCRWNHQNINIELGKMLNIPKLAYNIDTKKYEILKKNKRKVKL